MVSSAYVHLPFCRRRCFYCDFPISVTGDHQTTGIRRRMEEYTHWLCREITATPSQGQALDTIFFGGGTPSLLPVDLLALILAQLDQQFGIHPSAEVSLEIDPGTFTFEQLQTYQSLGINRVSLGVQAFQDQLLDHCGRSHTVIDIITACDQVKQSAIAWSMDLISGLPHQTQQNWQDSLQKAIAFNPHHISCYDLVVESQTPFGKLYQPGQRPLPTDNHTAQMYRLASQMLQKAGYQHYEVSNYAREGYQCRHNRVYWENQPYYGFGMGAASFIQRQRFTRPRTRAAYFDWVEEYEQSNGRLGVNSITETDHLLETLMLGFRLAEGLLLSSLVAEFGQTTVDKIYEILHPFIQQEWVKISPDHCRIYLSDPEGLLFSNTVLTELFRHFDPD